MQPPPGLEAIAFVRFPGRCSVQEFIVMAVLAGHDSRHVIYSSGVMLFFGASQFSRASLCSKVDHMGYMGGQVPAAEVAYA